MRPTIALILPLVVIAVGCGGKKLDQTNKIEDFNDVFECCCFHEARYTFDGIYTK